MLVSELGPEHAGWVFEIDESDGSKFRFVFSGKPWDSDSGGGFLEEEGGDRFFALPDETVEAVL